VLQVFPIWSANMALRASISSWVGIFTSGMMKVLIRGLLFSQKRRTGETRCLPFRIYSSTCWALGLCLDARSDRQRSDFRYCGHGVSGLTFFRFRLCGWLHRGPGRRRAAWETGKTARESGVSAFSGGFFLSIHSRAFRARRASS
jgi:hypothetical protein